MVNILVIGDDEKLNRMACARLSGQGRRAAGCLSAAKAFDRMIDNVIGLVIFDIMMPEADGFKFASIGLLTCGFLRYFIPQKPRFTGCLRTRRPGEKLTWSR
ncbi:MAG: hypothetical protein LBG57_12165 [Treponema sp.]|jgi:FixJ family two-component response regulator|nr:hypothetical protein [Treponema sp.]